MDKQRNPRKYLKMLRKNNDTNVEEFDRQIYKNEIDTYLKQVT